MRRFFPLLLVALMVVVGCSKDEDNTLVLTFEDVPASYLAGPTSSGENITTGYSGYHDPVTDLRFDSNNVEYAGVQYWDNGIAISNWTDKETESYVNQCSVYSSGGHSNSEKFGLSFGATSLYFNTTGAEYLIEEIWVMNSTYAALCMKNGIESTMTDKFTYENQDWFKLTIKGYNSSNVETGAVEFYLADFRTAGASGIITNWSKVDLTSLGKVHSIKFELSSSDTGEWGMNTPNYFCFDDVVVRR